jgi:hypothetical protein
VLTTSKGLGDEEFPLRMYPEMTGSGPKVDYAQKLDERILGEQYKDTLAFPPQIFFVMVACLACGHWHGPLLTATQPR